MSSTRRSPNSTNSVNAARTFAHLDSDECWRLVGRHGVGRVVFTGEMFLAEKTVKNYVSSILSKLGLERRTQAAVLASKILDTGPNSRR